MLIISLFLLHIVTSQYQNDVFVHYMPWFETPEFQGYWGWHWTMNNRDPNRVLEIIDGVGKKREIASHYYPLIGPYASNDDDVLDYHFSLMKTAGITGIMLNWYGVQGRTRTEKVNYLHDFLTRII